jgi:hypothetical protein
VRRLGGWLHEQPPGQARPGQARPGAPVCTSQPLAGSPGRQRQRRASACRRCAPSAWPGRRRWRRPLRRPARAARRRRAAARTSTTPPPTRAAR